MSTNEPSLFFGGKKIIAPDVTSSQVVNWLTGQHVEELSEFGYAALNDDHKVDSKYLPKVKLSVSEDNLLKAEEVVQLNFTGEYVDVQQTKPGVVKVYIGKPVGGTYFNTTDGNSDCLIKTDLKLEQMEVPNVEQAYGLIQTMYGDWKAGEIHKGVNYYPVKNGHCVCGEAGTIDATFWTSDAVYAPSKDTYFEITIWDARTNQTFKAITEKIGDSSPDTLLVAGDNKNILVSINDFTAQELGYTFKPVFKFDLSQILTRRLPNASCTCHHEHTHHHHHEDDHVCTCHIFGGRFRIEIAHIINENCKYVYKTEDFIYNTGHLPFVTGFEVKADINNSLYKEMYCSGIKYITQGKLNYSCEVDNLNNWVAKPVKMNIETQLLSEPFKYDEETQWKYYNLDYNGNNYIFSYSQELASALVLAGQSVIISGKAINGYGEDKFGLVKSFMINTITNCVCEESTDTKETFIDESKRRTSDMNLWNSIWQIEDSSNALMVIPNRGLTYPFGEFTYGESIPSQRYNYNNLTGIRYYYREFWGQFPDVKYGGTFKFTGLTKEVFLHNDFVLQISIDEGRTWLDCKKDRQIYDINKDSQDNIISQVALGIFAGMEEHKDGLSVKFAFNRDFYVTGPAESDLDVIEPVVAGNTHIWFKLGFSESLKDLVINKIELLNIDGKTNW